jgi:hypothetical protein
MRGLSLMVVAVLAAAVVVGVAAQVGDVVPGVPKHATALGAPWLVAAFATMVLAGEWRSAGAMAVLVTELALAAAILPACARRRAPLPAAALAALVLAVAFAAGEAELRGAMRAVGWQGV